MCPVSVATCSACRRGTSVGSSLGYGGSGLLCPCRPLPPTSDRPLPPRADEDFCCSAPAHFQDVPPLLAGSPAPSPGSSLLRTHDAHSCPCSFCQEGPFLPAAACFARLVPIPLSREPPRPHPTPNSFFSPPLLTDLSMLSKCEWGGCPRGPLPCLCAWLRGEVET